MTKSTKRIRRVRGRIRAQHPDLIEILLPSAFMEFYGPFRWPEEVYAGRLTKYGHRVSFEQIPKVG